MSVAPKQSNDKLRGYGTSTWNLLLDRLSSRVVNLALLPGLYSP